MQKNIVQIFLIAFLILGCGAPPSSLPAASPTVPSPTLTPIPPSATDTQQPATLTPLPTYTAEPLTATPEAGLQTQGPYFAYFQESNLTLRLIFVDADGSGHRTFDLPKAVSDAYASGNLAAPNIHQLSPNGKWLAYYTGSAGSYGGMPAPGTGDLTLNLMNLETGETQLITPLLSKDYPNNFTEAAQKLNDPDKTAETLFDAFQNGITRAIAWSPDGKYLAFAGQMEGLSSDLYLYDVAAKTIRRISSGDEELQWITWSPDGKWIVHASVYGVGEGMTFDTYAATADGSTVKYLSKSVLGDGIQDWISPHQYLEYDGENGPGQYGLRAVDIDTGEITKIWDGSFLSYAVSHKWVAMVVSSADTSPYDSQHNLVMDFNFVPAIYLFSLKSHAKFKVDFPESSVPSNISALGVGEQAFAMQGQDSLMLLSSDSKWTKTDIENADISVAPNFKYWLTLGQQIKIFSTDNTLLATTDNPSGYVTASWRPDSAGVFLISETEIYSLKVPEGNISLVDTNLLQSQNNGLTYGWVSGQ